MERKRMVYVHRFTWEAFYGPQAAGQEGKRMTLTPEQVSMLMLPLHPGRVLSLDGNSHLAAWDIRAMLTRVFGFAGWCDEQLEPTTLLYEVETTTKAGKPAYKVGYKASRRLTVMDPDGKPLAYWDASAMADQTMPDFKRADAHDFAARTAESIALKRCATNLGSCFGLSLYNGGSLAEAVRVLANDPRKGATQDPSTVDVEVTHDEDMVRKDGDDA
jgi:hypothetical protein